MIESRAEEEFHELRQKFHPHHDYLNLIIPSTWFLLVGVLTTDLYFYRGDHLKRLLARLTELQPYFASASTSLEFFLALFLFIVGFSLVYVIGQIINGASALILDRLIVKKLLKYPFKIYLRRREFPEDIDDRQVFRDIVLASSYLIFCLNLIPFIFVEAAAALLTIRVTHFRSGLAKHPFYVAAVIVALLFVHFGRPSLSKPKRYPESDAKAAGHYRGFFLSHCVFLGIIGILQLVCVWSLGWTWAILLLPAINILIGLSERLVRANHDYRTPYARRFFFYARLTFTSPIYLGAKLVGYGDTPSTVIIDNVRDAIGADCGEKDLFWMSYLLVQIRGAGASQTMYHFLAMYGMVRNLCDATAFALVLSVAAFWYRWPTDHEQAAVLWCLGLCVLMYSLFLRYLYVYGAYFSKYVVRAAAFIARYQRPK
jgi:hypothetical protein